MSKIVAVIQKPEETLTVFYEKLREAFQVYTPSVWKCQNTSKWLIWCLWPSHMPTFTRNFRNLKVSAVKSGK
jgi:hypothetical protein